jgi:hypothetical protein
LQQFIMSKQHSCALICHVADALTSRSSSVISNHAAISLVAAAGYGTAATALRRDRLREGKFHIHLRTP